MAEIGAALPEGSGSGRQVLEHILRVYDAGMDTMRILLRNEGQDEMETLVGSTARIERSARAG